ncbi:outer membrane protein [Bradyrhizobium sp.]|jgi:opacity protein-like surface antigen|uniref:outer membrane protein n=1 Tax=Bradyrhizobium sp. TaxID=376 RepID=UPI002DDCA933|nr:outer membrane protein [Bradyrhizobium sp.]HEV2159665.1 outer membrane protein [Bradyrhizobium sp.]
MKSFLAALLAIFASVTARAADMPVKAPIALPPPYNWSGFYLGANVGGAWTSGSLNIPGNNLYGGLTEFIGGVQAGYNFQAGHLLFGVEGDFDGATFGHPALPTPTLGSVSQNWIGTLAGRVGLVEDRWLVYGKFGGGWVQSNASLNFPGVTWQGSNTSSGWLAGAGIEYGFKSHWTLKLEYDQIMLGNWTSATVPPIPLNRNLQMVKFGANYKFESGGSDAVERTRAAGSARPADEDLAKQSQNPIADLVSVPFQSNTNFNAGPFNRTQEVLNIQPVVPLRLNADWNLISRTIMPVMSQPSPIFNSNTNGIGDITQEFFLSPTHPGTLIWGVGPVFTIPSATDPILGTGKVLFGPTAVALVTPGHWVIGVLANNQWSVGGNPLRPPVNQFLVQPFVNYNMAHGWYLTSSPIITANWLAAPGQQWNVPIGGGFGRLFKLGDQPVSASIQGFYNVVRPDGAPTWQLRSFFSLLFPER